MGWKLNFAKPSFLRNNYKKKERKKERKKKEKKKEKFRIYHSSRNSYILIPRKYIPAKGAERGEG